MADIAILVAEEYERRVKNSRKRGEEEIGLFSCAGVLGQRLKGTSSSWIKAKLLIVKVKEDNHRMEEKDSEPNYPKSKMAVAATNGFFSA